MDLTFQHHTIQTAVQRESNNSAPYLLSSLGLLNSKKKYILLVKSDSMYFLLGAHGASVVRQQAWDQRVVGSNTNYYLSIYYYC